jgi:hypothetical protein
LSSSPPAGKGVAAVVVNSGGRITVAEVTYGARR